MADRPNGNDPRRFAFWNKQNRERTVLEPFRHDEHHEHPARIRHARALHIFRVVFDVLLVVAWIVLIVMTLFFPSDAPDPRFEYYD